MFLRLSKKYFQIFPNLLQNCFFVFLGRRTHVHAHSAIWTQLKYPMQLFRIQKWTNVLTKKRHCNTWFSNQDSWTPSTMKLFFVFPLMTLLLIPDLEKNRSLPESLSNHNFFSSLCLVAVWPTVNPPPPPSILGRSVNRLFRPPLCVRLP